MKKISGYLTFFDQFSHYGMSEDKILFYDTKKKLEEYEQRIITPEKLMDLIEKRKLGKGLICSKALFFEMQTYVNGLFLLVHTAFSFGDKKVIPDKYFSLLNNIENFFMFLYDKSPERCDETMREAALKIIMIFNTWDKIVLRDEENGSSSGVYRYWSKNYFEQLYTKKKAPSYEALMYSLYRNCAEIVSREFLQKNFIQLSVEYGPVEEVEHLQEHTEVDNPEGCLIKYKFD